nr:unnamed protein product [Callosobruchus chinensis]
MDLEMCTICGKSNTRLFNVYTIYDSMNRRVFDDLQELYGSRVKEIINAVDCLCRRCAVVLDNLAKLKRRIWKIICSALKQRIAQKFDRVLQILATITIDPESDDPLDLDEFDKASRNNSPHANGTLLLCTHSETYNKAKEDKIAFNQYKKSQHGDNAKKDLASKRRRRKSSASVSSFASSTTYDETDDSSARSCSRASRTSACSSPGSDISLTNKPRSSRCKSVEYDESGRLLRKRTRSVSRAQEEEKLSLEQLEGTKYYCDEKGCEVLTTDIEAFTSHKKKFHNALALHNCQECKNTYTSAEHLQLHSLTHENSSFCCLMCGVEIPNSKELQKHLDKHLEYSVPCKRPELLSVIRTMISDDEDAILAAAAAIIIGVATCQSRCRRPRRFWIRPSLLNGRKKYRTSVLLFDEADELNLEYRNAVGFSNFFRMNITDFEILLRMIESKISKKIPPPEKLFQQVNALLSHYASLRLVSVRPLDDAKGVCEDRVDFKSVPEDSTQQNSGYEVHYLPALLDVNIDNLNMMNIDVYTEDNIRSLEVDSAEIEETTDEESHSQLLTSSVILEAPMGMGEGCNDSS